MSMKYPYRDLGVPFDRNFRNDLNANFDDIEHDIRMIGGEAAQQALEAAHEAETQAIYAQTSGDYANDKGDYAAQQGDYAKTQGDYAKAQGDAANLAATNANDAANNANSAATNADNAAVTANNAADNANTAADNANDAATNANTAADNANTQATNAQNAAQSANDAATNANNAADNANTQATYAQQQGDYAKAQGDYAKQVGDENKTRWLNPVATFADIATTYPNPQHGDTVMVTDDGENSGSIYRYENGQWNLTQKHNDLAIADVQNKIGILNKKTDGFVSVKEFGAKGDGVTDDTDAIETAITFAVTKGISDVEFPSGIYKITRNINIQSNSIHLRGISKSTCILSFYNNAKLRFAIDDFNTIVPTNPNYTVYNNMPYFLDNYDFVLSEFGGETNRLHNVSLRNLTVETDSDGLDGVIYFFKVDKFLIENIDITFRDPKTSIQSTTSGDPIRVNFCSDFTMRNVKVNDNYAITYGVFVYWSYGFSLEKVKVGNVNNQGIEVKHGVHFTIDQCEVKMSGSTPTNSKGFRVGYGSHFCTIRNCVAEGYDYGYSIGSSEQFDYTDYIHVENVSSRKCTSAFELNHLKHFTFKDIKIELVSYGFTIRNLHKQIGAALPENDGSFIKTSNFFTFDGHYDEKEVISNYAGIPLHYRYYLYKTIPVLWNGVFENINVHVDQKVLKGDQNFEHKIFYVITNTTFASTVSNGKIKTFGDKKDSFPIFFDNVDFSKIKILGVGLDNSNTSLKRKFIVFDFIYAVLKRCTFSRIDVTFDTKAFDSSDNFGTLYDAGFLRTTKLVDCKIKDCTFPSYEASTYYIKTNGFNNLSITGCTIDVKTRGGDDNISTSYRYLLWIHSTGSSSSEQLNIYEEAVGLYVGENKMYNVKEIVHYDYAEANIYSFKSIRIMGNDFYITNNPSFTFTNTSKQVYHTGNYLNGVLIT